MSKEWGTSAGATQVASLDASRDGNNARESGDPQACLSFARRAQRALSTFELDSASEATDVELAAVMDRIRGLVGTAQIHLVREIGAIEARAQWGELTVSFFGETNAGKSTLIEALTAGRGTTIGNGTKDFTKSVGSYRLDVGTGRSVMLLDMPGVEGVEESVEAEIEEAVQRSHAVFVVVGSKEPERGLLHRIRSRLAQQASVYAVINARGAPRAPMDPLESAALREVLNRTESSLRRELSGFFKEAAIVHAHVGFLASSPEVDAKFLNSLEKVKRCFESRDDALRYSGLLPLRETIAGLADAAPQRALVANAFKLLSVVQRTSGHLLREKKAFDKVVKASEQQLTGSRIKILGAVADAANDAGSIVDGVFRSLKVKLVVAVHDAIDRGVKEEALRTDLTALVGNATKTIDEQVSKITNGLEHLIRDELSILDARLRIDMSGAEDGGIIDLKKVWAELQVGIGYVLKEIGSVFTKVLSLLVTLTLNPILAAVAGISALIGKLFQWGLVDPAKRKMDAKTKAVESVETTLKRQHDNAHTNLRRELERLGKDVDKELRRAQSMLDDLRGIGGRLAEQLAVLNGVDAEIGTYVSRRIIGPEVLAAYVDLQLGVCIVGVEPTPAQLGILNQNRYVWARSFDDLIANASIARDDGWLSAPADADELVVRMLRAYPREVGARGVRRKTR